MNNTTTAVLLNKDFERDLYQFRVTVNIIGTCVSSAGYALMLMTAFLFPSWRKIKQNILWLHMCGTYLVFFSLDFYTYVHPIHDSLISSIVEHLKRYTVRVSLCWMLVGAWLTYKNLVDVFANISDRFMLKASLFSYLLPVPFVVTMFILYIIEHSEHIYGTEGNVKIGCNIFAVDKYKDFIWVATCILDNFLLVVPIIGSLVLYISVTYSICRNRKVYGHERDLASTVVLGFFFVFTCCVQCTIITAKYIFSLGGMWSYATIFLMAFHVSTYTTLFIICNKVTRQTWITYLKSKLRKRIWNTKSSSNSRAAGLTELNPRTSLQTSSA